MICPTMLLLNLLLTDAQDTVGQLQDSTSNSSMNSKYNILSKLWIVSEWHMNIYLILFFRFVDIGTCGSSSEASLFASPFNRRRTVRSANKPDMYTCQPIAFESNKFWVGDKLNRVTVIAQCGCRKWDLNESLYIGEHIALPSITHFPHA